MPSTLKRGDEIDQHYEGMFSNPDLRRREDDAVSQSPAFDKNTGGLDKTNRDTQQNADILSAKNQEAANPLNYTPGAEKKKGNILMKRRTPAMVLVSLLGAGVFGASFFGPAGALIHIAEVLKDKYDTMSSVVDTRGNLVLRNRMFATTATCKVKVQCKFSGLTERQMKRLEANGAKLVNSKGEPVKKNSLGRYTGGEKLILSDGKTEINAKSYKTSLRTNSELRTISRGVFAPRWASWNDEIAVKIKESRKLVEKPKWQEESKGDDKDVGTRKSIHDAVDGQSGDVSSKDAVPEKDKNGNPLPENEKDRLNFGEATDQINTEKVAMEKAAAEGSRIDPLPNTTGEAASLRESLKQSFGDGARNILNPLAFVNGYCGAFQLTKALIFASKIVLVVQVMRYASQFMSTADKLKAGDATSAEVAAAMTILYSVNKLGQSFGDSTGYLTAVGGRSSAAIGSSSSGNGVVRTLKDATVGWANRYFPGGASAMGTTCNITQNPWVQGGLSLTSFIPGGGAIKGIASAATKAGEAGAGALLKELVAKAVANITQDTIKELTKKIGIEAAKAGGILIGTYLIARYAVPALVRIVAGAALNGGEDGVTAMDTIANGFESTNNQAAAERGLEPLHQNQLTAFLDYKDQSSQQYASDTMATANPFDALNPYSFISQFKARLYPQAAKIQSMGGAATLGSIGSIFSSVNPLKTSTAKADSASGCDDDYLNEERFATSPFCNVIYGYGDTNMLENADPQENANWMYNNKQIDENGEPLAGSDYAEFKAKCIDIGEKIIAGEEIDAESKVDEECYKNSSAAATNASGGVKLAVATKWDNASEKIKRYRLYAIDNSTDAAMDYERSATPAITDTSTTPTTPIGKLDDPNIPCPAGTKSMGTVQTKYEGSMVSNSHPTIHLCQLSSISGSGNDATGARIETGAILNAAVAGQFQLLGELAKKQVPAVNLVAFSSFRLNDSCGGTGDGSGCAKPGQSMHQIGIAIDFSLSDQHKGTSTSDCSVRATSNDPRWKFLHAHAHEFGIGQYTFENWHWDMSGMSNRCS
jgi:hypothetical protein